MAVKSIIDIDVQDEKFKSFSAMYDKYQKALAKSPEHWAVVGRQVSIIQREISAIVASVEKQGGAMGTLVDEQGKSVTQVRTLDRLWRDVSSSTKGVASNLKNAVSSVFNMGSLLKGAASVLVGLAATALAGFGLDKVAQNVSAKRRTAQGLGLPYGAKEAFAATFGRVVDPDSFLSAIAAAKFSRVAPERRGLYNLGFTNEDFDTKDVTELSIEALRRAKTLASRTEEGDLGTIGGALGLQESGIDTDLLVALRGTKSSPGIKWEEIADLERRMKTDKTRFKVSEEDTRKYADFATTVKETEQVFETVFIDKAAGLAPLFDKLASSSASAAVALSAMATELGKTFTPDKATAGETLYEDVAGTIPLKPGSKFGYRVHSVAGMTWAQKVETDDEGELPSNAKPRMYSPLDRLSTSELTAYIRKSAIKHHVDPNVALKVAWAEGLTANQFYGDQGTSFGAFQLHVTPGGKGGAVGDLFKKYTGLDPSDPRNEKATIDYALGRVNKYGWGDWMGAAKVGVTGFYGVDKNATTVNIWNHAGANVITNTNSVANWSG